MIVVIGGGVVGLAAARAIAMRGRDVALVERHARLGQETSTHNSGVIHAGLYYPPESLKASLCLEGRDRLYDYCRRKNLPHARCGKLIVAQAGEEDALEDVARSAAACGASVVPVDRAFVGEREPHVRADRALWSPDSGWIDAAAFVRSLEEDLAAQGGNVVTRSPVVGVEPSRDGLTVITSAERIDASAVVNAAGLFADEVSALAGGERFQIYPCRGEYAELSASARGLVRGLVYPVPHASGHGLGVHLTKTIDGAVWIGPTIRYQASKSDYETDRLPLESFLEPTRQLLPSVTLSDLRLGGSGIRAKLHPPSERFADFLIRRDRENPYLIQAAGIESPGLTASLAIGERVAALALERSQSSI